MPINLKTIVGSIVVPPDGYLLTYSASDGYYIPKPASKLAIYSSPLASPYTVTTEEVVLVQAHVGTFIVNLPVSPPAGTVVTVKDHPGIAATNPINVTSGANIDGASPYAISSNYGCVRVMFNGTTWSILDKM